MATSTAPEPVRARFRLPESLSALSDPDFRLVWIGQAVSLVGTWMQMIAQGLVVLSLWNSAFALGTVNFANSLPTLAVMLFGGVLADRAEKRRILIVTQVAMGLLALTVGVLVATGSLQFWMLLCIAAMLGVAIGYDMPAYGSFLPEMVGPEKIGQVIALNSSTFHGSRLVGPAVAGIVIATLGTAAAFFLNAASFLAVILSLLVIRYRPRPAAAGTHRGSAMDGLKDGIRHVRGRPNLQALMLMSALNTTLIFPLMAILMPFYAIRVLDGGPGVLSALMGASGLGSVLGAIALIVWSRRAREAQMWFGVLLAPCGLIVLSLTRDVAVAVCASALVSLAFSSQFGMIQTMAQESTRNEFRGRVTSLFSLVFSGTMPIAGLGASALAVAFGLPTVMAFAALVYLVAASLALRFAAGGIGQVVRDSHIEYEAVAAAGG